MQKRNTHCIERPPLLSEMPSEANGWLHCSGRDCCHVPARLPWAILLQIVGATSITHVFSRHTRHTFMKQEIHKHMHMHAAKFSFSPWHFQGPRLQAVNPCPAGAAGGRPTCAFASPHDCMPRRSTAPAGLLGGNRDGRRHFRMEGEAGPLGVKHGVSLGREGAPAPAVLH